MHNTISFIPIYGSQAVNSITSRMACEFKVCVYLFTLGIA